MADNPQAYPCLDSSGCGLSMRDPGMTLLDYFAGQALPAVIAATSAGQHQLTGTGTVHDMIAQDAYRLAAAMLNERPNHD